VLGSVTSHSLRDSEQKPPDESMSDEDEEELHEQEPVDKEWFSKPSTPKTGTFNVN
jgi:hypothetical protein